MSVAVSENSGIKLQQLFSGNPGLRPACQGQPNIMRQSKSLMIKKIVFESGAPVRETLTFEA